VDVQPYCFLGIGATVGNKIRLGQGTFVGAHALVASDTTENSVHLSPMPEGADLDSTAFMRIMMAKGKL
jgi:carbonic anhydrase/acetyltransferase-like protein (isoleucine patch superfamily)